MIPLNKETHGKYKVAPIKDFNFVKQTHFARIVMPEFPVLASVFPIVFIGNPDSGEFEPGVMMGVMPRTNLFVDGEGKWIAPQIPASVRQYPFAFSYVEGEPEKWVLVFDENSGLLGDDVEGQPLFEENGEQSEILKNIMEFIGNLQAAAAGTVEFCRALKKHDLFAPLNIQVDRGEGPQTISDLYGINEQTLNNLPDEAFLEIRKKGYLPLIYAHLFSMAQLEKLGAMDRASMAVKQ